MRVRPGSLVAMSNSSDPYPPKEEELRLSRGCLEILKNRKLRVQIVTKSHLVAQDAHLLASMKACAAITITTINDSVSRRLEPGAPLPKQRLFALNCLAKSGVPTSVRIDPIIPGINDEDIEDLVAAVCKAGARHITSSTFKARPGSLRKIISVFPEECAGLERMFERGNRVAGSLYLPLEIREQMMETVRKNAKIAGLTFSSCREGFASVYGINCDGSHLLV
jgi:DNA repair photolyase